MHLPSLCVFAATVSALLAPAAAQVLPVAFESFDYPSPGLLINGGGGSGWANPWFVGPGNVDIVVFNLSVNPPFALADGIGNYAGQAVEFSGGFRQLDNTPHPELLDSGLFGKDNTTMWFSFSTVTYQQFGAHYGGVSLLTMGVGERLFLGSPWASNAWGLDDAPLGGGGPYVVPGTNDTVPARLVYRIDFRPGMERVRLWINPTTPHPTSAAPALDQLVPDFRWDEIRISSGGSQSQQFWDHIVIEKGIPAGPGTNYCPANPNTTGSAATISSSGSAIAASNNLTLQATSMPSNQFGIFITSPDAGFVPFPGGSLGNLCLGAPIGRYNGPGQVLNSGASGTFSLVLNLGATPTPTGPVAVMSGQTRRFQAWYRDFIPGTGAVSNFTNGLEIAFQ